MNVMSLNTPSELKKNLDYIEVYHNKIMCIIRVQFKNKNEKDLLYQVSETYFKNIIN